MAAVTYYVALPFAAGDDGPVALEAVECMNANVAITRAESLSRKEGHTGVIAFSRSGDPGVGDFDDAVVLRKFGLIGDLILTSGSTFRPSIIPGSTNVPIHMPALTGHAAVSSSTFVLNNWQTPASIISETYNIGLANLNSACG